MLINKKNKFNYNRNTKKDMIKKGKDDNDLSHSLKKNLKLRKKQVLERDDRNIIGKRTQKIGVSRLSFNDTKK